MIRPRVLLNHPPLSHSFFELVSAHVEPVVAASPDPSSLLRDGAGAVALVVRSPGVVEREVLEHLADVRCIVTHGSGTDTVNLAHATELGIAVVNNAGVAPVPVAEYVIAATLHLLKRFGEGQEWVRGGKSWSLRTSALVGREAGGRVMGIVGFGQIGREVARRARLGLNMRVVAYDPILDDEVFEAHKVERVPLERLLSVADVVSVHVPLRVETRGLIDSAALQRMRPDAVLINTSRGGVVDEAALIEALDSGAIMGAALDVFDAEPPDPKANRLFRLPRLLLTPHVAGITEESSERLSSATAQNLLQALRGDRPSTLVNVEVGWPPSRAARLGFPLA